MARGLGRQGSWLFPFSLSFPFPLPVHLEVVVFGNILGLLAFLVGEFFDRVEILFQIDLPLLEFLFVIHELFLGDDVVADHVVGYFTSKFITKIAQFATEKM